MFSTSHLDLVTFEMTMVGDRARRRRGIPADVPHGPPGYATMVAVEHAHDHGRRSDRATRHR